MKGLAQHPFLSTSSGEEEEEVEEEEEEEEEEGEDLSMRGREAAWPQDQEKSSFKQVCIYILYRQRSPPLLLYFQIGSKYTPPLSLDRRVKYPNHTADTSGAILPMRARPVN